MLPLRGVGLGLAGLGLALAFGCSGEAGHQATTASATTTMVTAARPVVSFVGYAAPAVKHHPKVTRRHEKLVALAFDDFPMGPNTLLLLDELNELHVKATFFAVGHKMGHAHYLISRALAEGHTIGNHTYSHARLIDLTDDQARAEILHGAEEIEATTGTWPRYLRAPGGRVSPRIYRLARQEDEVLIEDMCNAGDYIYSAQTVEKRVFSRVHPGAIICLHDGTVSGLEALPVIVTRLRTKGYQFVTVDELMSLKSAKR